MERALQHVADLPGSHHEPFPVSVSPMLASMGTSPFDDPNWLFEPKLDGIRAIALVQHQRAKLLSRRGLEITFQYPTVAGQLATQRLRDFVLDGEIVAFDERGRPSFQRLQGRMNLTRAQDIRRAEGTIPVVYFVFDLLYVDGYDIRAVPLERRKESLASLVAPTAQVRLLDHFVGDGIAAYQASVTHGLEGMIAKRAQSLYQSGRRSHDWLKIKATLSEEFVIGGFTTGAGSRSSGFGALLVGYFDPQGALTYAGHVGTGFDERTVHDLRRQLDRLRTDTCPFSTKPPQHAPVTWVLPELVAEVKFAEITHDGNLRAPAFLRLRPDSPAEEIRRDPKADIAIKSRTSPQSPETDPLLIDAVSALEQLNRPGNALVLRVGGHDLPLNNLDKVLWPSHGGRRPLSKRDLVIYLCKVAQYILPHMRDRPLTLVRYPEGIQNTRFFQKHWANPLPDFVETVRLFSEQVGEDQEYLICNNLATLLWLGQIADLELHCWLARVNPAPDAHHLSTTFAGSAENIEGSVLNYPDFIAFDLDPFIYSGQESRGAEPELNRKAFAKVCQVAFWLREVIDSLSLEGFVKTSGATGLHIFVPVRRQLNYDEVRAASGAVARFSLQEHPRDITIEWQVVKRTGKVMVDFNQNTRGKTLATIYSPRAIAAATVSMPVSWDDLPDIYPTDFTMLTAPDLIPRANRVWAAILEHKQDVATIFRTQT